MARIKVEHLNTIVDFMIMQLQAEEFKPEDLLTQIKINTGKLEDSATESLPETLSWALDEKGIVKKLFSARNDIPKDNAGLQIFGKTAVFAVKLAIIQYIIELLEKQTGKAEQTDSDIQLNKNLLAAVEALFDQGIAIFKSNNLNEQAFLLRRLMILADKLKVDQKVIGVQVKLLLETATEELSNNECNLSQNTALKNSLKFFQEKTNFGDDKKLIKSFIESSQAFFQNQNEYTARHCALIEVLNAWEEIKNHLELSDIEWLRDAAADITRDYYKQPTRYRQLVGKISQTLQVLNQFRGLVVGVSTFLGVFGTLSYWLGKSFYESRQQSIATLRKAEDYRKSDEYEKLDKSEQQLFNGMVELLQRNLAGQTIEQATANNEFLGSVTNAYPYVVTAVAVAIPFFAYYLNKPAAPSPIVLPDWVAQVADILQSQQHQAAALQPN